jgi:ribosome-binding protein aMBF1 (putative translation factor)
MAGNWKDMLLKKNVPIIENKPVVKRVIPQEIVNVKPLEKEVRLDRVNEKDEKVEYFGVRGQNILKLRNEKKMTQKELANRLAMNSSDLQHIESGKAVFNNGLYKKIINYLSNQ